MIEELVFTSAKRGLQIGKSGFCTVASTPGMAANLARLLESLSGYRHLHPPGSAEAKKNPVIYSHLKAVVGGRSVNVLSQIRDAGFDYSNRSNKLAHHLAIRDTKAQSLGPANVLTNPTHFISSWNQDPTKLDPRALSGENCQPKPCATWQSVTGDAGWAGDLIEAVQKRRQAYLIVNESTPSIQLIQEALALLPVQKQWGVTFSTFFTKLPPKIECNIRCVLSGSPEVAIARRSQSNYVLDLTKRCGPATSRLADIARQGKLIGESTRPCLSPGNSELALEPKLTTPKGKPAELKHSVRHDVDDWEEYDLVEIPPELKGGKQTTQPVPPAVKKQSSGAGKWIGIAGAFLLLAGLSSLLFLPGVRESISSFGKSEKPEENTVPNTENTENVEQKLKAEEEQKALGKLEEIQSQLENLALNRNGLEDDHQKLLKEIDEHSKELSRFDDQPFQEIGTAKVNIGALANESYKLGIESGDFWKAVEGKVVSQLNEQTWENVESRLETFEEESRKFSKRVANIEKSSKDNINKFKNLANAFSSLELRESEIELKKLANTFKRTKELIAATPCELEIQLRDVTTKDQISEKVDGEIETKSNSLVKDFKQLAVSPDDLEFIHVDKHLHEMHKPNGFVIARSTSKKKDQHPFGMELTLAETNWTKKNADDSPSLLSDLNENWLVRTSLNTWEIHPNAIGSIGTICFEYNCLVLKLDSKEELADTFDDTVPDATLLVSWEKSNSTQRFYFRPPKRYLRIVPEGFFPTGIHQNLLYQVTTKKRNSLSLILLMLSLWNSRGAVALSFSYRGRLIMGLLSNHPC